MESNSELIPQSIDLLCGQEAEFDHGAGFGYRCTTCNAVIGSIGMSSFCAKLYTEQKEMQAIVDKLKGTHARR